MCCGISEEAVVLLSEAECLHFFCPPCEGEVFNLVNKKTVNNSSSNDIVSTVTDTISKAIRDLQAAMQTTISSLLVGPRAANGWG